jgi:hypothetical protein
MFLGGATALLLGFDSVMTERGMAMSIGGTVAIGAGILGFGLVAVSWQIGRLRKAIGVQTDAIRRLELIPVEDEPVQAAPALTTTDSGASENAPHLSRAAPGTVPALAGAAVLAPTVETQALQPVEEQASATGTTEPTEHPDTALSAETAQTANNGDSETVPADHRQATSSTDNEPDDVGPPIASYEANGRAYLIYENGSVQVTSAGVARRFASLDELQKFIAAEAGA